MVNLDLAVQRFVDAWMAFPGLLLLLTIMSIAGSGLLADHTSSWGSPEASAAARVLRGAVIGIKENDYFLAARGNWQHKMRRNTDPTCPAQYYACRHHHLQHHRRGGDSCLRPLWASWDSVCQPSIPELGRSAQPGRASDTWRWRHGWLSGPVFALTITIYSLNMLGDALRDLLDPRLRGGEG